MKISGLQKLTLLDFPGKVACTVFLGGCNFRCPFCHNSELLGADAETIMEPEELLAFLKSRQGILDGVCITGGEPTLQRDLPELLRRVKELGFLVKLDTNGYRPEVLRSLVTEGLVDYVAMDVKNSPERYALTCGISATGTGERDAAGSRSGGPEGGPSGSFDLRPIEESIRFLLEGSVAYELRTTVVKPLHDAESIGAMGEWLLSLGGGRRVKALYIQPFVDRDTVAVAGLAAPEAAELADFKAILEDCALAAELRGI